MRKSAALGLSVRLLLLGSFLLLLGPGDRAARIACERGSEGCTRAARPIGDDRPQAGGRRLSETYARRAISFEPNQGQADGQVKFLSRGNGYSLFLTSGDAVFSLRGPARHQVDKDVSTKPATSKAMDVDSSPAVMRMKLVGANPAAEVTGTDLLPAKSHYFMARDPAQWRTNVPNYAKVRYKDVYPGVDLVYHGNRGQLEYDFVVASGADPDVIRISFPGVREMSLDTNGDIVLSLSGGEMRQHKPVAYQEVAGVRHEISARYVMGTNGSIAFEVADYDPGLALVIDPVLVYSTYLGGTGNGWAQEDFGSGIAADAFGNSYVTGMTGSSDFPLVNPLYSGGGQFVAKFDPGGALVYSTYLPGVFFDIGGPPVALSIAADALGHAYVTGFSDWPNFPTTPGAFRTEGPGWFTMKLSPDGSTLVYSTFAPTGPYLAVDAAGNAYLAGLGLPSAEFPAINPFPTERGNGDAVVAKLNASGSAVIYAASLGGSVSDRPVGIAVDGTGSAYLAGITNSPDFPTVNAAQPFFGGGSYFGDCWVARLNAEGSALLYSTYLGGSEDEQECKIAGDPQGNAYVLGPAGHVSKLSPDGALFIYSHLPRLYPEGTILAGQQNAIAADHAGNAYVTGSFEMANSNSRDDVYVTKINPSGSARIYSMFLGGSYIDHGFAIAADAEGAAYVTGMTGSTDFPIANAVQPTYSGGFDAFVVKIADPSCPDEVTDRLDVLTFPVHRIVLTPYRYQWVLVRNKTALPIEGPLSYVMSDLQNATFLNTRLMTACISSSGDPFTPLGVGSDNVLSPGEWRIGLLFFQETRPGPISYIARVLSGTPLR